MLVFGTVTSGNRGLPYYQMYFKELTLRHPRAAIGDDYARAIELAAAGVLGPRAHRHRPVRALRSVGGLRTGAEPRLVEGADGGGMIGRTAAPAHRGPMT